MLGAKEDRGFCRTSGGVGVDCTELRGLMRESKGPGGARVSPGKPEGTCREADGGGPV